MKRLPFLPTILPLALLAGCDSSDGIGPEPGCETVTGDVVVATQANVEALADVCAIAGALEIREAAGTDDPITSLAPLAGLRSVGTEGGSTLRVLWTTALEGLEGLEGVSLSDRAELRIEGNAALESLAALGAEADGAVTRFTTVRVWQNAALTDLDGLDNLAAPAGAEVTSELSLWSNPALSSLAGLEAITGPVEWMYLASNPALLSLALPDVTYGTLHLRELPHTTLSLQLGTVRDALLVEASHGLTTLSIDATAVGRLLDLSQNSGLESLALTLGRAPEAMVIDRSHLLSSFQLALAEGGLGSLAIIQAPELTTLGFDDVPLQRGLALYDTGLADLDAFSPVPALAGFFILVGNQQLADIEAFSAVQRVEQLQIEDNPALCVPAWVADVEVTGPSPRSVDGNLCD